MWFFFTNSMNTTLTKGEPLSLTMIYETRAIWRPFAEFVFNQFSPKQGDNATKIQGERETTLGRAGKSLIVNEISKLRWRL